MAAPAAFGFPGGSPGAGGAGIIGAGLTIINSGTIAGGTASVGSTILLSPAIIFTGGTNRLTLKPGSNITGNVIAENAVNSLTLTGDHYGANSSSMAARSVAPAPWAD